MEHPKHQKRQQLLGCSDAAHTGQFYHSTKSGIGYSLKSLYSLYSLLIDFFSICWST